MAHETCIKSNVQSLQSSPSSRPSINNSSLCRIGTKPMLPVNGLCLILCHTIYYIHIFCFSFCHCLLSLPRLIGSNTCALLRRLNHETILIIVCKCFGEIKQNTTESLYFNKYNVTRLVRPLSKAQYKWMVHFSLI